MSLEVHCIEEESQVNTLSRVITECKGVGVGLSIFYLESKEFITWLRNKTLTGE